MSFVIYIAPRGWSCTFCPPASLIYLLLSTFFVGLEETYKAYFTILYFVFLRDMISYLAFVVAIVVVVVVVAPAVVVSVVIVIAFVAVRAVVVIALVAVTVVLLMFLSLLSFLFLCSRRCNLKTTSLLSKSHQSSSLLQRSLEFVRPCYPMYVFLWDTPTEDSHVGVI